MSNIINFREHSFTKDEFLKYVKNKIKSKEDLNQKDKNGCTALMLASIYSNNDSSLETVKELIKSGANLDLQNEYGWTALMLASRYSNDTSSLETVKELINSGANLNLQHNHGWTALMLASYNSNNDSSLETVKELIKSEANLDLQNKDGWTALMLASKYSNNDSSLETVKELIKSGANLDLQNEYGWSALMLASYNSNNDSSLETVKELINSGANLDLQNKYGNTCLSYLVRFSNSLEFIKKVISRGVSLTHLTKNIEKEDEEYKYNGSSLLHRCAIGINENTSSYEILEYLETLEIDKSLKNQEGKTYKEYLINYKHCYVVSECEICYNKIDNTITILHCECNCGRVCYNCSQVLKGNKCPYCRKTFNDVYIFKFIN